MITRKKVTFVEGFYDNGDPYIDVVMAKDGQSLGTIWAQKDGSFDYESFITGMSWNTIGPEPFEDVVQHLIDEANNSGEVE